MTARTNARQRLRSRPRRPLQGATDLLPKKPRIRLRHGQAIWLLTELGYRGAASRDTFYEYIKSLRKLGIPFGREKFVTKHRGRRLAGYSYCHLMELAIALSLRVYHVAPDSVLREIIRYRSRLYRLYRKAYAQRRSGAGAPIAIIGNGQKPVEFRGLFLDLNINFSGGDLVHFGPPSLLSPAEALRRFNESVVSASPFLPMSLSVLSERLIALALRAPDIHSGPLGRSETHAVRPL
jgi:hypothetical protein